MLSWLRVARNQHFQIRPASHICHPGASDRAVAAALALESNSGHRVLVLIEEPPQLLQKLQAQEPLGNEDVLDLRVPAIVGREPALQDF